MDKLYLGINGQVVCLNKDTGDKIWNRYLKSSNLTNLHIEDDVIFAYAGGHLFCLNAEDGSTIWRNTLKGFGYGPCIIASQNINNAPILNGSGSQQSSVAAAGAAAAVGKV